MFDSTVFLSHLTKVNSNLSRVKESSLESVLTELGTLKGIIDPPRAARLQALIHKIPHDKLQKYSAALTYLEQNSSVVICGKPVDPVMVFLRFDAGEYSYQGLDGAKPILNSTFPNYRKVYSFHHVFDFKFKSSTGNLLSLQKVGTREHVKFRTAPGSPPFNAYMADTPQEFYYGESKDGANSGYGRDDHMTKPPCLICAFPLVEGEAIADQWYEYTINKGQSWQRIEGAAYNIIKGVRRKGNGWVFYLIKKNWSPHNNKAFHFEVEYDLLPPLPPIAPGAKLMRANGVQDTLSKYGRLIRGG